MRRVFSSSVMFGVLFGVSGTAMADTPAESLIVNGSFEEPVGGGFYASITGWTPSIPCNAQGGPVQVAAFSNVDGSQALELNTGCAGNGIQQTVPTTPGATYTLVYGYSARPGTTAAENHMEVRFDGEVVETVGPVAPKDDFFWYVHQVDVTASGSSAVLEFASLAPATIQGNDLDFVVLLPKTVDFPPLTPIPGTDGVTDIACPSATSCVVMGISPGNTLGTITAIDECTAGTPQFVEGIELYHLGCMSETSCIVVGEDYVNGGAVLISVEDGVAGEPVHVEGARALFDIACGSETSCVAVGAAEGSGDGIVVTIEDGVIGELQVVNPGVQLFNIDCSGPTSCVATTNNVLDSNVVVAIEGGVAGAPQPLPTLGSFVEIECSSNGDCIGVGQNNDFSATQIVIIRDGVVDSVQTQPDLFVYDAACSDSDCVLVGAIYYGGGGFVLSVVDGVVGAPQAVSGVSNLEAVDCSGVSCLATGYKVLPSFYAFGVLVPISGGVAGAAQYVGGSGGVGPIACGPSDCTILGYPEDYSSGGFICTGPGATPTIEASAVDPVYAGGDAEAFAVLSGGNSPTGTVTFELFAPGDESCAEPIATRTVDLDAGSADSGPVSVSAAGIYNWVAYYDGDLSNTAVATECGATPFEVLPQTKTGRAFGLRADGAALTPIHIAPTPDTGAVETTASSTVAPPCVANVSGPVGAKNLCVSVETTDYPGESVAVSSVGSASVSLLSIPAVTIGSIEATSTTTCDGSVGTTTIGSLKVGGTTVISTPTVIAPNTAVNLGVVHLVLNEQIPFSFPDDGLTVNAVHITINLGITHLDAIVGSAESDIADCP